MQPVNTIGLIGGDNVQDWMPVLSALAEPCGVVIEPATLNNGRKFQGLILAEPHTAISDRPDFCHTIRVLQSSSTIAKATIVFGDAKDLPFPYKRTTLTAASVVPEGHSKLEGEVIGVANDMPIWATATIEGLRHASCWVSRPWIRKEQSVSDHLNGDQFMNLLPILEWLRVISNWHRWQHPPLRASFMFDDPNLHAKSFGFIRFDQLAEEGKRHHYHTSFATVPLDAYYVSSSAAHTVRENQDTLSLLVHGINHTRRELSNRQPLPSQMALMQQAIRRIEQLEGKAQLSVARVMAPPHGICSAEMMKAMAASGFEAVCVSHGSVRFGNPDADWITSLGSSEALVIHGLPVIPRFGLSTNLENEVRVAAYLNQAIVVVGHHWDLAKGPEILASTARLINRLGTVRWIDMTQIARSNFRFTIVDDTIRVETLSRITAIEIPEGVTKLELCAPWRNADGTNYRIECVDSAGKATHSSEELQSAKGSFPVTSRSTVQLRVSEITPQLRKLAPPQTPLRAIARRLLVEARDRAMPYLPEFLVRK